MADDSKKKQKGKHEAKEHRRKRQARLQPGPSDKKPENEPKTPKATAPEKSTHQPPGPDFYEGLKRETDEILKISEEENSKYRNKEILSNWAKYEMPIESYEEMDEQDQLGADYETLIQAPLSVGTHFQFKHEKSWDVTSGPSPYQKYFDIEMGNLVIALSTIPFYERNSIEKTIFTDNDLQSMDQRATLYKHKYYSDTKYNTPELEALSKKLSKNNCKNSESVITLISDNNTERNDKLNDEQLLKFKDINDKASDTQSITNKHQSYVIFGTDNIVIDKTVEETHSHNFNEIDEIKHLDHTNIIKELEPSEVEVYESKINIQNDPVITNDKVDIKNKLLLSPKVHLVDKEAISVIKSEESAEGTISQKEPKQPIIESPEDLEKWLDDFLDN